MARFRLPAMSRARTTANATSPTRCERMACKPLQPLARRDAQHPFVAVRRYDRKWLSLFTTSSGRKLEVPRQSLGISLERATRSGLARVRILSDNFCRAPHPHDTRGSEALYVDSASPDLLVTAGSTRGIPDVPRSMTPFFSCRALCLAPFAL